MEPTEENVRAWNEAHRPPQPAQPGLPQVVRDRLPALEGRHVLHLRCGTGEATAELASLGAFVTAVDPSPQDLAAARANAPTAAFVHAELDRLPLELLRSRFHLVYAARGTLAEVRDVEAFAHGVLGALRPGASSCTTTTIRSSTGSTTSCTGAASTSTAGGSDWASSSRRSPRAGS